MSGVDGVVGGAAVPPPVDAPAAAANGNMNNVMTEVTALLRTWEEEQTAGTGNPVPTLTRLAEIIELETENYLKMDPDPFDERHPSRTDPDCKLGQILKAIFRKEIFMNKLVTDYLRDAYSTRLSMTGREIDQLNIAACRLMLDVMPGLETSVVFHPDSDALVHRLIKWTTESIEPLQSYATGLLAAAMEIPDIATKFREQNAKMVPLLLQRLRRLQTNSDFIQKTPLSSRPFAHFASSRSPAKDFKTPPHCKRDNPRSRNSSEVRNFFDLLDRDNGTGRASSKRPLDSDRTKQDDDIERNVKEERESTKSSVTVEAPNKRVKVVHNFTSLPNSSSTKVPVLVNESSNSSWAELENFMIGNIQIFPPTQATRQILILRYLTPMGEYQEFLSHVFENNALELILSYVNVRETKQARLGFEALKYLAALLCHKKFCIEFIQYKGLEVLLEVPRPSIAATGVSICLYYLGYCEEAMERVCLLPKYIIKNLVRYALWLLECSHDSGRCHATMFFGLTFQFKVILEEFDAEDGLRKLHNVIAILPILMSDSPNLDEDTECAARQIVRHVCVAYKRYLEAHLYTKAEYIKRSQLRPAERAAIGGPPAPPIPIYKPYKSSPKEVQQQIELLLQHMPFRSHWAPVDQLLKLGGIMLLLKIIAFSYEWNYSGRAETVRCALDVLAIACVMPKVQVLLCDRVDLPEESITLGFSIILGAAEGEIVADADVQKSALRVIVNCVCAPMNRVTGNVSRFSLLNATSSTNSPSKKPKGKSSEELIQRVWDCVRSNSGIMVLLTLMTVKLPITDADCIRTLACKALAGLVRSDTVKQIVSKLPLFQNGQLQSLMKDPILQEKRQEHVTFQKHALELLERLSGKTTQTCTDSDVSLVNIHRASVVAQTKIQFNESQLLHLIHQHLTARGLSDTALVLQKEANLGFLTSSGVNHPSKFRYTSGLTPTRTKLSFTHSPRTIAPSSSSNNLSIEAPATPVQSPAIKIIKKNISHIHTPSPVSRLQKQIAGESFHKILHPSVSKEDSVGIEPKITLNSIITEYLANQHSLCKNPMATCPQFNLFAPHKCPDPKPRVAAANNFAMRYARPQMGYNSKTMDRRLIHSRFCPVQTIRQPTDDGFYTCARFMPGDQSLIVGQFHGEVRIFNINTGNEEATFQAHDSYIVHMETNWAGDLLLTSTTWGRPLSALWSLKDYDMKFPLEFEDYVEFSHVSQDKILGTKGETATIYDAVTGLEILRLIPTSSNQYTKNKATFSINDKIVLSDGVLFDVASGKQIHKLVKLNQLQSGVFHPNGLEIVSNSEIWDLRTYNLLRTVPALNHCNVIFSPVNNAIYATSMEQEIEEDTRYDSSFKTLDATDYTNIATIDVKKNIYDLAVNRFDSQIAVVENQGMYHSVHESVVRLYDVGRRKDDEEDDQEEDDDDDEEDMDDSSDGEADAHLFDLVPNLLAAEDGNENEGGEEGDRDEDSEDSWTDLSEPLDDDSSSDSSDLVDLNYDS